MLASEVPSYKLWHRCLSQLNSQELTTLQNIFKDVLKLPRLAQCCRSRQLGKAHEFCFLLILNAHSMLDIFSILILCVSLSFHNLIATSMFAVLQMTTRANISSVSPKSSWIIYCI